MNALTFVDLLLVGIVFNDIVVARKLEEGDTKLSISVSKSVMTNGLGDELTVISSSSAYGSGYGSTNVASGPASANAYGSGYGSTSGYVIADGPNASASSGSSASGQGGSSAAAGPGGASGSGYGSGGGSTSAQGSTSSP